MNKSDETKVIVLGGLGEVGRNMYCVMHKDEIIILDAGVSFAGDLLGIDYVLPDYSFLKQNEDKIKALFITHGHEDHIGAIPFLLQMVNIPAIYAPNQAKELIDMKLKDRNIRYDNLYVYNDQTTVKFKFAIKVTNEGEIAGYVKEISDYIPEGLKFVAKDNPDWKETDGKVVTDKLKDTLLEPGESATVEIILTWINNKDNMGEKINWAEISKDENEYNSPDIDSTPNNQQKGEDDIDSAPVILSVVTGNAQTYITLIFASLSIFTAGVILIKKFVI